MTMRKAPGLLQRLMMENHASVRWRDRGHCADSPPDENLFERATCTSAQSSRSVSEIEIGAQKWTGFLNFS